MNKAFIILWMIFFHIIDDYVLQAPCLCNLKQKSWWEKNAPDKKYERDYIWALLMHSFSWSFMIMLPVAYYHDFNVDPVFLIIFVANVVLHALTDDVKANDKAINLWADQIFHLFQIILTALWLLR